MFFCDDAIEDELHFLFDCKCYHDSEEYNDMTSHFENVNPQFKRLPNIEKWIHIQIFLITECSFVTKDFI